MATGRESDKFMLRLPEGMRDLIKAAADTNKRSMNAEIVVRLEKTLLSDEMRTRAAETSDGHAQLVEKIRELQLLVEAQFPYTNAVEDDLEDGHPVGSPTISAQRRSQP